MKIAVVGAGVGGLCAAIELAHQGHQVSVYEQNDAPGGKCSRAHAGPFTWDAGPSLLTMPQVFKELFADTGAPLEDELELLAVEPVTRYEFPDGSQVTLSADLPRTIEALEAFSPGAGADWQRFMSICSMMWRASEPVLRGPPLWPLRRPHPGEPMPDPRDALRLRPWATLRGLARSVTRDRRLQLIIERFATYAGADPRRAPAALATAGYLEHVFGAWHPRGGLYAVVEALVRRLEALEGELHLGRRVEAIEVTRGAVRGVHTGTSFEAADAVVADVDGEVVRQVLLGQAKADGDRKRGGLRRPLSLSGFALLLGLDGVSTDQPHHLIRFSGDYDREFDDIFLRGRPADDPTLYICAPRATDPAADPPGRESWFVLVNVPAVGDGADWANYEERIIDRLGIRSRVLERVRRSPGDLERETAASGGAIYGRAPHGRMLGLPRPARRVRGIDGLWLAGGTVHPGGGLPLVALGGRSVAREISRAIARPGWR